MSAAVGERMARVGNLIARNPRLYGLFGRSDPRGEHSQIGLPSGYLVELHHVHHPRAPRRGIDGSSLESEKFMDQDRTHTHFISLEPSNVLARRTQLGECVILRETMSITRTQ